MKEVESSAVASEESHLILVSLGFAEAAGVEGERVLVQLFLHCFLDGHQELRIYSCRVSLF